MSEVECRVHKLVADVAVLTDGRVLMVRYEDTRPYDGQRGWFLPDDHLTHLEDPADAARRIAKQQAGLDLERTVLGLVESFGNGAWHIIFHHRADLEKTPDTAPGPNVRDLEWFALDSLPPAEELAHHGWALDVLHGMGVLGA